MVFFLYETLFLKIKSNLLLAYKASNLRKVMFYSSIWFKKIQQHNCIKFVTLVGEIECFSYNLALIFSFWVLVKFSFFQQNYAM